MQRSSGRWSWTSIADELWRLIATPAGWREWLVDDARLVEVLVVERGIVRQVRVDEVVDGRVDRLHLVGGR